MIPAKLNSGKDFMEMFCFNEVQWEAENVPVAQLEHNIRQSTWKQENYTTNKSTNKQKNTKGLNKLKYFSITKTKHLDSVPTEMKVKWCTGTCFLSKIFIINKIPIGNFFFFFFPRLGFGFWAVGRGFDSFSPKENCCHPDLLSKGGDAGEWNFYSFLLKETYVFYKIDALGWFLSKNALRRGKAKLLLPRLSSCKDPSYSAFTGMLWNTINHSDNVILVKIKA